MANMMRHLTIGALAAISGAGSAAAADQSAPQCDRTCLEGFATHFLDALTHSDPSRASLSPTVKYSENQQRLPVGDGLWKNAKRLGNYRIFISDIRTSQSVFMGNVQTGTGWSMLTVRLKIADRKISEVEIIIPGDSSGDGTYQTGGSASALGQSRAPLSTALVKSERRDRSQLIQAAELHYAGIERGNGDIVPFGDRCIKVENGVQLILNPAFPTPMRSPSGRKLPNFQAMGCTEQFNTHVWDTDTITDRRYPVVDEERGIVVAFAMYNQYAKGPCAIVVDYGPACPAQDVKPFSLAMAEAFKVRDGLIEEVESVFTVLPDLRVRGIW